MRWWRILHGCGALVLPATLALACGGAQVRPPPPLRTCLVLSVGGIDGLAHLGAVAELQRRHVQIDCVYGNSMGALVGSLYASAPRLDIAERYRTFMRNYVQRGHDDWDRKGLLAKGWAILSRDLPKKLDLARVQATLDEMFSYRGVDQLPLAFATSYQVVEGSGVRLHIARSGNLASAVAHSINNLLLFPSVPGAGDSLDPGTDRVAKTPIDDACSMFPDARLLVLNATGEPSYRGAGLHCPVQELRLQAHTEDPSAFLGDGPAFDALLAAGRAAVAAMP